MVGPLACSNITWFRVWVYGLGFRVEPDLLKPGNPVESVAHVVDAKSAVGRMRMVLEGRLHDASFAFSF